MRKIVLLKPHEPLSDSFTKRNFSVAANFLQQTIRTPGATILPEIPIRVPLTSTVQSAPEGYRDPAGHNYAIAVDFQSEEAERRFASERGATLEGIYADPQIQPFPTVCPGAAVGNTADVQTQINIGPVHASGLKGRGVRIAVVDTGIDGTKINVAGGLNYTGFPAPGASVPNHGTMVAFDALIAAPDAMIYDYPLLSSKGGMWIGFLSDAIRIYSELLVLILQIPGPLVAVNSWGMYDRSTDKPRGDPQNYSSNPRHPFNLVVAALVNAGADVVFAAGNCGSTCPDGRCGAGDVGPGNSIHGANSHPDVICTGAVTFKDELLGYSSEGPGALLPQKPDIAASSHFLGSKVFGPTAPDTGTSAACPVLAGVVAALRSKPSARTIASSAIKAALMTTARQPAGTSPGWNPQTGWGIANADKASSVI